MEALFTPWRAPYLLGLGEPVEGCLFCVLVGRTDEDGRFKIRGLGPEIDAETVVVSCELEGYRLVDAIRRRLTKAPDAPVEVECLMEKAAKSSAMTRNPMPTAKANFPALN